MVFCNCVLPLLLVFRTMRESHLILTIVAISSIVGMWLERYNTVTMTLTRTHLPSAWGGYAPTLWDWAVFGGTLGLFLTGFLIALCLIPIVSMYEMRELLAKKGQA
jgi:molybdopterin-containing oxidoreductase family membrane subunit